MAALLLPSRPHSSTAPASVAEPKSGSSSQNAASVCRHSTRRRPAPPVRGRKAQSLSFKRLLANGSSWLLTAGMRQRRRRQRQRERGLVPCKWWPALPGISQIHAPPHSSTQVFNENGGMPLTQQRKRLPIYGNRNEFLCAHPTLLNKKTLAV
jgi:hypothetical protein